MAPKGVEIIATEEALKHLAQSIVESHKAGEIGDCYVDTEADSLHHYQEKLCLIQLCVGGQVSLIDTLAVRELAPLLDALDALTVWFHGADYDLTLLKRTYQWTPSRMRDTQIAARLTGHREFGLSALVQKHVGIALSKASQKADWSRRPLPQNMVAYAAEDVIHLPLLASKLLQQLSESSRTPWFLQSCENLSKDVMERGERNREESWRVNGSGKLRPKGLAFIKEAWMWREGMARKRDVPPFRVMNNQQLVGLAGEFETEGHLSLPPRWRSDWKQALYDIAKRVLASDPETWPQRPQRKVRHISDVARARVEELCKARDLEASKLDLEPSLIGSRAVYEQIVHELPPILPPQVLMPWQLEIMNPHLNHGSTPVVAASSVE